MMDPEIMPAATHVRELRHRDLLAEAAREHLMEQAFTTTPSRQHMLSSSVLLTVLLTRVQIRVVRRQRHPRTVTPDLRTLVTD